MSLTDVGINFISKKFKDPDNIISSAIDYGIEIMIAITNNHSDIYKNMQLCRKYKQVYCTVGVHPHNAKGLNQFRFNKLDKIIVDAKRNNFHPCKIVAIGECGLDYDRYFSKEEDQKFWFEKQLELAIKHKIPVYLHCRDAHTDFFQIINTMSKNNNDYFRGRAIVHCFTAGWVELKDYLDAGYYVGITGWITDDRRNHKLVNALKTAMKSELYSKLLLSSIMVETDSPWLYPRNIQGKSSYKYNVPENVSYVIEELAILLNLSEKTITQLTFTNCKKLFNV